MVGRLSVSPVLLLMFFTAVCVFVNESKTWTEAQSYCRQTYTDLATISNMDEMKKLNSTLNTLKNAPNSSVWIGLKKGVAGKWLWSLADGNFYRDGDTYRNWREREPDNGGNRDEYCVAMFKDKGDWFDEHYFMKQI
uniref:C-type lectin domain-containing protein n=1 Tax=Pygocentrus nattereri TaxID=42514 RepID=A0AAR2IWF1_PYGNA